MSSHLARLLASATPQAPRPVQLHIERVALAGLPMTPSQTRAFASALTHALSQLMRDPGLPENAQSLRLPSVAAPAIAAAPSPGPASLGREVARSVFEALRSLR